MWSHWPALIGVGGFLWLELAYHTPASPRVLGVAAMAYSAWVLGAAARWGQRWLRTGEGFGVLFSLIATMAPIGRDKDGHFCLRLPFTGLATVAHRRGTAAVILTMLGGTTFDGLTRTTFWADIVGARQGWAATVVNTIGLLWVIGLVSLAWVVASRLSARLADRDWRDPAELVRYLPSLIPIMLAYSIAHYFSLFVFETQTAIALASDPFARSWDLFGTIDYQVDYRSLSPAAIAYVQASAIVVGHVAGVVVAHDRAVAELPHRIAVRSQYPFLVLMITYTVVGLLLLLNA